MKVLLFESDALGIMIFVGPFASIAYAWLEKGRIIMAQKIILDGEIEKERKKGIKSETSLNLCLLYHLNIMRTNSICASAIINSKLCNTSFGKFHKTKSVGYLHLKFSLKLSISLYDTFSVIDSPYFCSLLFCTFDDSLLFYFHVF